METAKEQPGSIVPSKNPVVGLCYVCREEATRCCAKCGWAICKMHRDKMGIFDVYYQCHPCCRPLPFDANLIASLCCLPFKPLSHQETEQNTRQRAVDALLAAAGNVRAASLLMQRRDISSRPQLYVPPKLVKLRRKQPHHTTAVTTTTTTTTATAGGTPAAQRSTKVMCSIGINTSLGKHSEPTTSATPRTLHQHCEAATQAEQTIGEVDRLTIKKAPPTPESKCGSSAGQMLKTLPGGGGDSSETHGEPEVLSRQKAPPTPVGVTPPRELPTSIAPGQGTCPTQHTRMTLEPQASPTMKMPPPSLPPPSKKVPPPPPLGRAPPPPPPPSLLKTFPSAPTSATPQQPLKTKPIFWERCDSKGSFWASARDELADSFDGVERSNLEEAFAKKANTSQTAKLGSSATSDTMADSGNCVAQLQRKTTAAALFGPQRDRNVSIVLQFFRMSAEQLERAVLCLDDSDFGEEQLTQLLSIAATPDEVATLQRSTSFQRSNPDYGTFSPSLKYLIISSSQDYVPILQCRRTMITFPQDLEDLNERCRLLNASISAVKTSKSFQSILKFILSAGNILNEGTALRNADAFRISDLQKVAIMKAADPHLGTLLDFVVEKISTKRPQWNNVIEELAPCQNGYSIDVAVLSKDFKQLKADFDRCIKLSRSLPRDNPSYEVISSLLRSFVAEHEVPIAAAQQKASATVSEAMSLAPFFGEKESGFVPHELLEHVAQFRKEYAAALKQREARAGESKSQQQQQQHHRQLS